MIPLAIAAIVLLYAGILVAVQEVGNYAHRLRRWNERRWVPPKHSKLAVNIQVEKMHEALRSSLRWGPGGGHEAAELIAEMERLRLSIMLCDYARVEKNLAEVERRFTFFAERAREEPIDRGHPRLRALRSVYNDISVL